MELLKPFNNSINAIVELIAHLLVVAALLVGFRVIELLLDFLWETHDKVLFGIIPVAYIFEAADFAILCAFLVNGIYRIIIAYGHRG